MLIRAQRRDDSGYAMLLVIASVLVMTIFATGALLLATNRQPNARRNQDFNGSYQAAAAGIDDYIARLQANPNYFTQGNSDATNAAMSGFTALPGAVSGATYKYSITSTSNSTLADGVINITATGKVNGKTRTVTAKLTKQSFLDYMYFTQYETIDPVAYSSPPPAGTCDKYTWATPTRPLPASGTSYCSPIYFQGADTLRGPVYSQDTIQFNGSPTFNGTFKTGWNDPARKYYACIASGSCTPTFASQPTFGSVPFPTTNLALRSAADTTVGGTGCIFKGPTNIVLNAAGTMTVISPYTPSTFNTGACGTHDWGVASTTNTINVPSGEVVWIDGNSTSCSAIPTGFPYPVAGDVSLLSLPTGMRPTCSTGDAFVQGWMKGQLTIAASNNIFVTNSIRYVGSNSSPSATNLNTGIPSSNTTLPATADTTGTDVLGLSAANFVQVYHPLTAAGTSITSGGFPHTDIQIDGAIVASAESFIVDDWDKDNLGVLTLNGGIIQKYRGPVGTSAPAGYDKNYNYDTRLHSLTPPHLQEVSASAWNSVALSEGSP